MILSFFVISPLFFDVSTDGWTRAKRGRLFASSGGFEPVGRTMSLWNPKKLAGVSGRIPHLCTKGRSAVKLYQVVATRTHLSSIKSSQTFTLFFTVFQTLTWLKRTKLKSL